MFNPMVCSNIGYGLYGDGSSSLYNGAFDATYLGSNLAQETSLFNNYAMNPMMNFMSNPMTGTMNYNPMMSMMGGGMYTDPTMMYGGGMMGGMPGMYGMTPTEMNKLAGMDSTQKLEYTMGLQNTMQEKMFEMQGRQRELALKYKTRNDEVNYNYNKAQEQLVRGRQAEQNALLEKTTSLHRKICSNRKDEVYQAFQELVARVKNSPEFKQRIQQENGKYQTAEMTDELAKVAAINLYSSQFGDLMGNIRQHLSGSEAQGLKRIFSFGLADRENADSLIAKIFHNGVQEGADKFLGLQWTA